MREWCVRVALFDGGEYNVENRDKLLQDLRALEIVGHVVTTDTGCLLEVLVPDRCLADQIVAVLSQFGINAVVAPVEEKG